MRKAAIRTGVFAISAAVIPFSSAIASSSDCRSIAEPVQRLACYDKAANATVPSAKTAGVKPLKDALSTAIPAKPVTKLITKALPPVRSGPQHWFEADFGFYASFRNVPGVAPTAYPFSAAPIATSPGFIGLDTISTIQNSNPLTQGLGGGGNFKWGSWLNPEQTMAVEVSAFFGLTYTRSSSTQANTATSVNTTPDVFVGLFNDNTTVSTGGIWDLVYGADLNYRMTVPNVPYITDLALLFGVRYVGLDEFTTTSSSVFTRTYQPALGLPPPFNAPVINTAHARLFGVANNFFGPQTGFDVEKHWGPYWVEIENKVAVGGTIEPVWSGPTSISTAPTTGIALAGIPLTVANGGPPSTETSGVTMRIKGTFTVVPSGTIKVGYDIVPGVRSLTLAYNYLYMSDVGLISPQVPSPGIKQSSFLTQGITLGLKEKF